MPELPAWLKLLQQLCEIDSTTEQGAAGATQVSTILGDRLRQLGFDLQWLDPWPSEGKRGKHLVAVRNVDAPRHLLFIGHSDTVLSPAQVPFRIDYAQGRIFGSGVCDMKGGDVLMLTAIEHALKHHPAVNDLGLVVLMNCAEENASPSFPKLVRPWSEKAVACLGFEPARPGVGNVQQMVISRKGSVRYDLTVHGKAAHAGNAHPAGISAIRELARMIEAIESLTDYSQDITANVGMISGGLVVNQVAPVAHAGFELRAYDPAQLERLARQAQDICSRSTLSCPQDGTPTRCELVEVAGFPAWRATDADKQLAAHYINIARDHGVEVIASSSGGGSDASQFSELIPTVDGLGIFGGAMHSPEEWADIATFEPRMLAASALMGQLAQG